MYSGNKLKTMSVKCVTLLFLHFYLCCESHSIFQKHPDVVSSGNFTHQFLREKLSAPGFLTSDEKEKYFGNSSTLWKRGFPDASNLHAMAERENRIDPDARRDMTELIHSQGYPSENYTVQTADGFLLDLHRIPHGRAELPSDPKTTKPVVFLQHGLLSSSCDWVMNFANGSLGFILADAGYDVFMGNSRGNTYSRRHITLKPSDVKFWDWSYDEMAKYDLPAFIDFVLNKTNQSSLYYVGHSQGTTMAFALFSQRPEYQKKVKSFVALAPVATITHCISPIKYLASIPDKILLSVFGRKDFLPNNIIVKFLVDLICPDIPTRWVCSNILFLLAGPDLANLNTSRVVVYMNHLPAGTSTKDLIHFAQVYREKKFQMFNYGSENMKHYNQTSPPEYDVTKVNVPILAFTGSRDWLADPQDASTLIKALPNVKSRINYKEWNHLDFIWGKDAAELCYYPIIDWLNKQNSVTVQK